MNDPMTKRPFDKTTVIMGGQTSRNNKRNIQKNQHHKVMDHSLVPLTFLFIAQFIVSMIADIRPKAESNNISVFKSITIITN